MAQTKWHTQLTRACQAFAPLCAEWRQPELKIEAPASAQDVDEIQRQLPVPIPQVVRNLFTRFTAAMYFIWVTDSKKFQPPAPFEDVVVGQCDLELKPLKLLCDSWFVPSNMLRSPEHGGQCRFDYQALFPLMEVGNGDLLMLPLDKGYEGKVVYFAHEGLGGMKRVEFDDPWLPIIAPSLQVFLDAWFSLGCPGPDIHYMMPFLDPKTGWITGDSANADAWRKLIGLG